MVVGRHSDDGPGEPHDIGASCEREVCRRAMCRRVAYSGDEGTKRCPMVRPRHAHRAREVGRRSHGSSVAQRCGTVSRPVLSPNGVAATEVSRPPASGEAVRRSSSICPDHGASLRSDGERGSVLSRPCNRTVGDDGRVPRVSRVLLCERMSPLPVRAGLVN